MELRPHQSLAPSGRCAALVSPLLGSQPSPLSYPIIIGKFAQHPSEAFGHLGFHVAKPKGRFDSVVDAHAAMHREHPPDAAVQVLYLVRHGGNGAFGHEVFFQAREERPGAAERDEASLRLPEPLVLEAASIVCALLQKPLVVRTPPVEARHPFCRLLAARNAHEVFRDGVKVDSRLRLRPGGGASFDLAEGMEGASLKARVRPHGAPCLLDAPASVADENVRRRDARHEARPILRVLAPGEMAAYDMVVRAGDEHDAFSRQPDAIHVDDMVDLVANGNDGPEAPKRRRLVAERARSHPELRLRELPQKPADEGLEIPGSGVVALDERAAA